MSSNGDEGGRIDRRALRTRHLLTQALMELGAAGRVDALDVGALAATAGIGRSTFYAHFANKQDFLTRSFTDMIKMMERAEAAADPDRADLLPARSILAHVADAREFAARMADSEELPRMMAAGETTLRDIAQANLARRFPAWSPERRRETAVYVAGGFVGLLRWWLENGVAHPPERVLAAFERLTKSALATAEA